MQRLPDLAFRTTPGIRDKAFGLDKADSREGTRAIPRVQAWTFIGSGAAQAR